MIAGILRKIQRTVGQRDLAFDRALGVDTAGAVHLQPAAWAGGVVYLSVDEDLFDEAMAHARVDHARYTFVDFGSGKGKALLLVLSCMVLGCLAGKEAAMHWDHLQRAA